MLYFEETVHGVRSLSLAVCYLQPTRWALSRHVELGGPPTRPMPLRRPSRETRDPPAAAIAAGEAGGALDPRRLGARRRCCGLLLQQLLQ